MRKRTSILITKLRDTYTLPISWAFVISWFHCSEGTSRLESRNYQTKSLHAGNFVIEWSLRKTVGTSTNTSAMKYQSISISNAGDHSGNRRMKIMSIFKIKTENSQTYVSHDITVIISRKLLRKLLRSSHSPCIQTTEFYAHFQHIEMVFPPKRELESQKTFNLHKYCAYSTCMKRFHLHGHTTQDFLYRSYIKCSQHLSLLYSRPETHAKDK